MLRVSLLLAGVARAHTEVVHVDHLTPLETLPAPWGTCKYDACTSPADTSGYPGRSDCWSGTHRETCTCSWGHPRATGRTRTRQLDSVTEEEWEYACCEQPAPEGKTCGEEYDAKEEAVGAIIFVMLLCCCIPGIIFICCHAQQQQRQRAALAHGLPPVHHSVSHAVQPAVQMTQPVQAMGVPIQPAEVQQMQVQIPLGSAVGQPFLVSVPGGAQMQVTPPPGFLPGQMMDIQVPAQPVVLPTATAVPMPTGVATPIC